MRKRIIVTGGAGFIGSAVVRHLIAHTDDDVLVVDKLTYAGNLDSLASVSGSTRFRFMQADIADLRRMSAAIAEFRPTLILHLAAESHVDRSIDEPDAFIQTNIVGTYALLEASLAYWRQLSAAEQASFRFHHVSTDEVFGSLGSDGYFTENSPYQPNSPYSASKAASDHLVRAWHHTYGFPTIISNCSNNYGPFHFPEKLIPLMILNGLEEKPLPVYGTGNNVRDWLYVDDHARALLQIATKGTVGDSYNVGCRGERTNLQVVHAICDILDELVPSRTIKSRRMLIQFVPDRPGHDHRYAIDPTKIIRELGWQPQETFESGLRKTIMWYLENRPWWEKIRKTTYRGERLGVAV